MSRIYAPFTDAQVRALQTWQETPALHPFTCSTHSETALLASSDGWHCPVEGCTYTQNWAHDFMIEQDES